MTFTDHKIRPLTDWSDGFLLVQKMDCRSVPTNLNVVSKNLRPNLLHCHKVVKFEYDPSKEQPDLGNQGISLSIFIQLDWANLRILPYQFFNCVCPRFKLVAELQNRLDLKQFKMRGKVFCGISLRKANNGETRTMP